MLSGYLTKMGKKNVGLFIIINYIATENRMGKCRVLEILLILLTVLQVNYSSGTIRIILSQIQN